MGNSLEERLQQHSHTFDGLLSLIPAKYYYDDESNNQWLEKQNKKSKDERKINKSRKLNPEDTRDLSVKEIMEETEKVAKPVVLPGEKVKVQRKQEQIVAKEADKESDKEEEEQQKGEGEEELFQLNTMIFDDNGDEVSEELQKEEVKKVQKAVAIVKKREISEEEKKARESKQKELKAKLQEKIQKLREKRKAVGSKAAGSATSRQQILEERRRKETLRKEKRKAMAAEESSDSSDSSDSEAEDASEDVKVIFGNIEFNDGERISSDLKSTRKLGKKKGPSNNDIKGHLQKIERERSRLQELDSESRQKHEEKTKWKRALANVQGEKLKDDEKLLKKALRRKDSQKRKSEREWMERKQNLADELKMKTDRREENLRIRRENRSRSKKDQIKHLPSYKRSRGSKKMTKRAGFEGGYKKRK